MKSVILSLLLMAALLSGCVIFGEEEAVVNETEGPPPPPPPKTPVILISNPVSGEMIIVPEEGGEVDLVITTQNLILKPAGGSKKTGEGHFLITVNGQSSEFSGKIYSVPVIPGEYTVEVELRHNDRTSYSPSIVRAVSFAVQAEEPEVYVPREYTVKIRDFSYDPEELTIKVSDKVVFVNEGTFPRSATCFISGKQIFDTGVIGSGKQATITAEQIASCEYYSTTHRAMTGKLVIESAE
ncbi:hypothetical protein JXA56_01820 [Candidatus Micrarchaeota archaeon]|nr:hypothetical protein [Candidatus Micrarchaeota archaeon]